MKGRVQTVIIDDIPVEMIRKRVKYLRLVVSPPVGHVRLSVPYNVADAEALAFVRTKLDWVRHKRARFEGAEQSSLLRGLTGEQHYFLGKSYKLTLNHDNGRHRVDLSCAGITLTVRPCTSEASRLKTLDDWYRAELKARIPAMLAHWQSVIGVKAAEWGVKKMRTRWGSCNINRQRIWLNLELVKRDPICIEFVLVHELVHLLERYHNARFYRLMDDFMPEWRQYDAALETREMLVA